MQILKSKDYIFIAKIKQSEVEKFDFALCEGKNYGGRLTLEQYYEQCDKKPALMVNGGYFNMANGETIWAFEDEGKPIMDYGVAYHKGIGTVNGKLKYGEWYDYNWTDFLTAYPMLVIAGAPIKGTLGWSDSNLKGRKRRTAVGWNNEYIYIICVDNPGLTLEELQALFMQFNCDYASNLDGGGSTRMLYNGTKITPTVANRAVDNVVAVYLKTQQVATPEQPKPQTLYRVQVGAYSKKENSEAMLIKLKAAVPECKDAYVRKIGDLYKVQCGAFSIKDNAERLKDKIINAGFSAFITTT